MSSPRDPLAHVPLEDLRRAWEALAKREQEIEDQLSRDEARAKGLGRWSRVGEDDPTEESTLGLPEAQAEDRDATWLQIGGDVH